MAFDSAHPLFQTTDTFQQLINDLNYYGDRVDSNFRYIDSAFGPGGNLFVNGLTTDAGNFVDAINELQDSVGRGGLDTVGQDLVAAVNEIESVFDASAGTITPTGDLVTTVPGDVDIFATGEMEVDVDGRIILDAGTGELLLRSGGTPRVSIGLGNTNNITVNGGLLWDVTGDITFDADGADFVFADGGTTIFSWNTTTPSMTAVGNYQQISTGNTTLDAGGEITLDADDGQVNISTQGFEQFVFETSTGSIKREETFTIDGGDEVILDAATGELSLHRNGVQYGQLKENSGNLTIKSADANAIVFTPSNALFAGNITMPASGTGSPHTASLTVAGALAEVNARIPNVYDRLGNLLNP